MTIGKVQLLPSWCKAIVRRISLPERAFIAVALLVGGLFVVLIPPMQAPDELSHFFRAYQVSTGQVVATTYHYEGLPATTGGPVPESMKQFGYQLLQAGWHVEDAGGKISARWVANFFNTPLAPENMATAQFAGGSVYSPVLYLPQSAGMLMARLVEAPAIVFLYAGRICNLLVFIALVYAAIRCMPFAKWGLVAIALLPTTLTQAASLSGDAITNALAFLAIAYFLYLYTVKDRLAWQQLGLLSSLVVVLPLTKSAFIVFAALPFLLPAHKFSSIRARWWIGGGTTLLALALAGMWSATVADFLDHAVASMKPWIVISPPDQLVYIVTHPFHFAHALASTFMGMNGTEILKSFVGTQYPIPLSLIGISYATLIGVWLSSERPAAIARQLRIWLSAIAVAGVLAVSVSLYFIYNAVGSATIEGLNGRYFMPLAPLCMLVVMSGSWKLHIPSHRALLYALGVGLPLLGTIAKCTTYFYGWRIF